jgi:Asp-tRNA(Asn)/Glu-tRNA(Gln) amidotransferase C subunit
MVLEFLALGKMEGGDKMMDEDTFLAIAKASGLEMGDSHCQELYAYVEKVLPNLKAIGEVDLTGVEPMTTVSLWGGKKDGF